MHEEAADEFEDGNGHGFAGVVVSVVAEGKGDHAVAHGVDAFVGDGDEMGGLQEANRINEFTY
jgi:hypothetical protein